eukprot:IDg16294t1
MRHLAFAAPALLRTAFAASAPSASTVRAARRVRVGVSGVRATMSASSVPVEATQPTVFDKIIAKEIPVEVVYEDDDVLAFHDINPQAPVHCLIIPKRRISMLSMAQESDKEILGTLLLKANVVAQNSSLLTDTASS